MIRGCQGATAPGGKESGLMPPSFVKLNSAKNFNVKYTTIEDCVHYRIKWQIQNLEFEQNKIEYASWWKIVIMTIVIKIKFRVICSFFW